MNKTAKVILKILAVLVVVLVAGGVGGWMYLKSVLIGFEDDYAQEPVLAEMRDNGYSFTDRNGNGSLDVYEDNRRPLDERIEDLLSQMTLEEKIHLLKGSGIGSAMGQVDPGAGIPGAAGTIVATPRLGIPAIYLSDGPAGLRIEPVRENEDRTYYCTAFPIATLLASSWNVDLVRRVGSAMGNEALEYGIDVILGPGANIHRNPLCGRNFEYYSEDPVLTGYMGAAMVNGIESQGVGASLKHFVANNQETNRNNNDVIVSERALREIYLKGFEITIRQSQPWTVMSSYNKVNGTYTAESQELLTGVLRNDWGYNGLVMSDWFGGNDAPAMIRAGNDLLEPGTRNQWNDLIEAQENGVLSETTINTAVRRILRLILASPKMRNYVWSNDPDLEAHARVTRKSASEGMVLLKNNQTLPLEAGATVALLGVTSFDMITGGTGSGDVNEAYIVSLEEGLVNNGFRINETSVNLFEEHKAANEEAFVRPEGIWAMIEPYTPPEIKYSDQQLQELAQTSDVAIFTIGRNSGEGGDRVEKDDFLLSEDEQMLLTDITKVFHLAGKKVVVVLNIGGVIETASWKEKPDAVLLAWQGGQESGNSVADILSGKVNPSGKLPMTFPISLHDHASTSNFPLEGKPLSLTDFMSAGREVPEEEKIRNTDYTVYEEGIYVGYRHFDKAGLKVSFPFGYGLSYTDFTYSEMQTELSNDTINMKLSIQNTGDKPGMEVVQVYVSKLDPAVDRPEQELKAFGKTRLLAPDESDTLTLRLPLSELRHWDEVKSDWVLENGRYEIRVGSSSRDIRLRNEIEL